MVILKTLASIIKLWYLRIFRGCKIGKAVKIYSYSNIYGCEIGDYTQVGSHVTIQKGARIGNKCKIGDFVFIPDGTVIEDECFIGAGTKFCNDKKPEATNILGELKNGSEWKMEGVLVLYKAAIGINCTILPGVIIGHGALVGAGSVVTKNVPGCTVVAGNPAKIL